MCASRESVRDIMLAAEEIGMLNTGQYVFINTGEHCASVNSDIYFFFKLESLFF